MAAAKQTTKLSTKGQVILPKAVRDRQHWQPGMEFVVEETPDGVLLRPEPTLPPTRLEDVFGMLKSDAPPLSIEDMGRAVLEEARRQHRGFNEGD